MLNMKSRQRGIHLMKFAVLAAVAGPFSHSGPRLGIHSSPSSGGRTGKLAGLAAENRHELVRPDVSFILGFLFYGQFSFRALESEFVDSSLEFGIRPKTKHVSEPLR